jgi:hypothetical protein
MAITNAQQYKQLLANGGRIGLVNGSRRSKYDSTGGGLALSSKSKDISPGPSVGGDEPKEPPTIINKIPPENFTNRGFLTDVRKKNQQKYFDILNRYKPDDFNIKNRMDGTSNLTEEDQNFISQYGLGQIFKDLAKQNYENFMDIYPKGVPPKVDPSQIISPRQYDFAADGGRIGLKGGADASQFNEPRSRQTTPTVTAGGATFQTTPDKEPTAEQYESARTQMGENALNKLYDEGVSKRTEPSIINLGLNLLNPIRNKALKANIDFFKQNFDGPLTLENYRQFMNERLTDPVSDEDDNQLLLAQALEPISETVLPEEDPNLILRRFAADGGIMGGLADGQLDDMGRQMYGLGKLVKKITGGIKKIAKSPIGRAALLYAGTGALGNLAGGSGLGGMFRGIMSPSKFLARDSLRNIFSGEGLKNIAFGKAASTGYAMPGRGVFTPGTSGLLGFGGELNPFKAISLVSTVAGLLTPEQKKQAQLIADETGIDIQEIEANPEKYLATRFMAEGGDVEPVAKKTMPLLDMDGKEMDLRQDGGFVPIGRMERADDVPARLSKNEFVFTADAVRNAGEGDIDKGAEVMYNMMKNLEAGGEVSEESQGIEGARKMFQTSQRLEEVL